MKQLKRKIEGVYLLVNTQNKVVYVGQSQNILQRLVGHKDKDWDYVQYEEILDRNKRAEVESVFIKQYQPIYNTIERKIVYPDYVNRTPRKVRWELMRELKEKYRNTWDSLSCRQVKYLLYSEYGIIVNHNTVNTDLHNKKYTVLKTNV